MERRVVSLWLPTFATDWLSRRRRAAQPGSRSEPLATVTAVQGGQRIAAANLAAQETGVIPGLPLADARALAPTLHIIPADPAADARALAALADWCGRYTPWTAVDLDAGEAGGGGLWLDVSGCAHLFGGEAALLDDLAGRLRGLGYSARAAIADTPGAAWAVARFAGIGRHGTAVVPQGEQERIIAPLPVAGLRLDTAMVEGLSRLGLRRIGDLLALPRAPLVARLGNVVVRRLDQALGRAGESLSPRRPVPAQHVRLAFVEPISRPEDTARATRRLIEDMEARLETSGRGARRLTLTLYRVDGTCAGTSVGTSRPVRDPDHLCRLFRERLKGLDPGFGIEVMTLSVPTADDLGPVQTELGSSRTIRAEGLARLVDRLGNRFGPGRVTRLVGQASHIPERVCREVSALAPDPPIPREALEGAHRPSPARPLHLLPSPEPIDVLAPVPDHPPVMFRWRRRQHRVARAEGPERIGPEWWREERLMESGAREHLTRDYYRVEDREGGRYWVYREGFYRPGLAPRWYLHGVFP